MEKTTCTVGQLFGWYMRTEQWAEDWQTTNALMEETKEEIVHAQDDGQDGMSHLKFLKENENEEIQLETTETEYDDFDIKFSIKDRTYILCASVPPFN